MPQSRQGMLSLSLDSTSDRGLGSVLIRKTCDVSCSYLRGRQHDAALATSREEEMA